VIAVAAPRIGVAIKSDEAVKVGWSIAVEVGVPQLAAVARAAGLVAGDEPAARVISIVGLLAIKIAAGADIPVAMVMLTVVAVVALRDAVAAVNVTDASAEPWLAPTAVDPNVVWDPVTAADIWSCPFVKM
jgi:hypothetical protein